MFDFSYSHLVKGGVIKHHSYIIDHHRYKIYTLYLRWIVAGDGYPAPKCVIYKRQSDDLNAQLSLIHI